MKKKKGGIIYDPASLLKKIAPRAKVEKILSSRVTVKKTALSFLTDVPENLTGVIDKKSVVNVALKVVKNYKSRIRDDRDQKTEILDDPKLLIQRVQNEVIQQVSSAIKERYQGEFYRWLPSSANEPDPEHQLNYGQVFRIGDGEMPGDRYGCQCGMEILTDGKTLDLNNEE